PDGRPDLAPAPDGESVRTNRATATGHARARRTSGMSSEARSTPARANEGRDGDMDARLEAAARALSVFDPLAALQDVALRSDPPGLAMRGIALAQLADIGVRSVRPRIARRWLERARAAARVAAIPSLTAEVDHAVRMLDAPVARLRVSGAERFVDLDEAEAVLRSRAFVVDACRREVHAGGAVVSLVARPVLFSLVVALGEAAPGEATRELL